MLTWNLADLFGHVAAAIPDRLAVSSPLADRSYGALDTNATSFARHLVASGVEPGERVAILSWNRVEWLEAMIGCFRAGAVPINVNYRYVDEELEYILDDSDSIAIVCEPDFLDMVRRVRQAVPMLSRSIVLDGPGGAPTGVGRLAEDELTWTAALVSGADAAVELPQPSPDDRYILYTGGTTGMPKGVVWRQEDIFLGAMTNLVDPEEPAEVLAELSPERAPWLVTSPLMHGNGQWNSLRPLIAGNGVSLWTERRFDPDLVIRQAAADRAQLVVLIGDGMARPFADALRGMLDQGVAPDLTSVAALASGGAILSPAVKEELAELLPDALIVDGFGASESGGNGVLVGTGDGGAPRFQMKPDTTVLDDDDRPMAPGTGHTGRLARTGHIPLGYHKDPEKTAATFPTDDQGRRWAVPGDAARLEADGTITVFGRGSNCINTGGEKVFPEEVEAKIKAHPGVHDAFVLGRPDERFGQRVAAVIARRPGSDASLDDVRAFLREHLAGYKLPKEAVFVDQMSYTGPGKPDYSWAKAQFQTEDVS
jgi:fatty-acyl-CoA synthase